MHFRDAHIGRVLGPGEPLHTEAQPHMAAAGTKAGPHGCNSLFCRAETRPAQPSPNLTRLHRSIVAPTADGRSRATCSPCACSTTGSTRKLATDPMRLEALMTPTMVAQQSRKRWEVKPMGSTSTAS